jgi:hypothetical protein
MKRGLLVLAVASCTSASFAGGVVIDGQLDPSYVQKPIAVQDTQTGFGDSNLGVLDYANGNELDTLHYLLDGDYLHLLIGGNLEGGPNWYNKLEVFIDFKDGGQNRLLGNNPDVDFNGLNRMGDPGDGTGLTFDKGFAPDFYLTMTAGGTPLATYANTAELLTKGGGTGGYIGSGGAGACCPLLGSNGVEIGLDNSNAAGVTGGSDLASGAGVTTGMEIKIPRSLFAGYKGGDIKISVILNGLGHDYLSNQFLPGIGGGPNLAEPRLVNLAFVPGAQFAVIPGGGGGTPCPGDFDGSGNIDAADLATFLGAWGTKNPKYDLAGDGGPVGASDLSVLLAGWGACN